LDLGCGDADIVEHNVVETLGQPTNGSVASDLDLGDDVGHGVRGSLLLVSRTGQGGSKVAGDATKIDSAKGHSP
jgi:hypothetical protein